MATIHQSFMSNCIKLYQWHSTDSAVGNKISDKCRIKVQNEANEYLDLQGNSPMIYVKLRNVILMACECFINVT